MEVTKPTPLSVYLDCLHIIATLPEHERGAVVRALYTFSTSNAEIFGAAGAPLHPPEPEAWTPSKVGEFLATLGHHKRVLLMQASTCDGVSTKEFTSKHGHNLGGIGKRIDSIRKRAIAIGLSAPVLLEGAKGSTVLTIDPGFACAMAEYQNGSTE